MDEYEPLFIAADLELDLQLNDDTRRAELIARLITEAQEKRSVLDNQEVALKKLMVGLESGSALHSARRDELKRVRKEQKEADLDYIAYTSLLLETRLDHISRVFVDISFPGRKKWGYKIHRLQKFLAALLTDYTTANEAHRLQHGVSWESLFRRNKAFEDPNWRVLLPHQFLPLGNTTPDLHQVAELLVRIYKAALRKWTVMKRPDSTELLLAKNYDEELHEVCKLRNTAEDPSAAKDKHAIRGSIRRAYIAAQCVATPRGEVFQPMLAPGDVKRGGRLTRQHKAKFKVVGSGGYFSDYS